MIATATATVALQEAKVLGPLAKSTSQSIKKKVMAEYQKLHLHVEFRKAFWNRKEKDDFEAELILNRHSFLKHMNSMQTCNSVT